MQGWVITVVPLWSQGHIWMPGFSAARSGHGADPASPHRPTCGPSLCTCTSLQIPLPSTWTCRRPRPSSSDPPGRRCSGRPQWSTWRSYAERRPARKIEPDAGTHQGRGNKDRTIGNWNFSLQESFLWQNANTFANLSTSQNLPGQFV